MIIKHTLTTAIMAIAVLSTTTATANQDFPGIRALMTEAEFKKAGLGQLSNAEIEALDLWLISYTAKDSTILRKTSKDVKKELNKVIETKIVGYFTGWSGDTEFQLENGHIWKQRMKGQWKTSLHNPNVTIKKNFLGFYMMRVDDTGEQIGVKRLR